MARNRTRKKVATPVTNSKKGDRKASVYKIWFLLFEFIAVLTTIVAILFVVFALTFKVRNLDEVFQVFSSIIILMSSVIVVYELVGIRKK